MDIFITKKFEKFLKNENLHSHILQAPAHEVLENRCVALGAKLFKVRMKASGRGKSGGYRIIVFLKVREHLIFLVLFAKNERDNISDNELKALKLYAGELDKLSPREIRAMVDSGALIELVFSEEG